MLNNGINFLDIPYVAHTLEVTDGEEELVFKAETTITPYSSQNYIYGSYDRDEAMILETLLLMNRDQAALQQAKKVSKNLAEENWFSNT